MALFRVWIDLSVPSFSSSGTRPIRFRPISMRDWSNLDILPIFWSVGIITMMKGDSGWKYGGGDTTSDVHNRSESGWWVGGRNCYLA